MPTLGQALAVEECRNGRKWAGNSPAEMRRATHHRPPRTRVSVTRNDHHSCKKRDHTVGEAFQHRVHAATVLFLQRFRTILALDSISRTSRLIRVSTASGPFPDCLLLERYVCRKLTFDLRK